MSHEQGFLGFLLLTVLLLVAVAWTGLRAKRRLHIPLVLLTVASLGMAIRFALKVGQHYDLKAAGAITPIHMFMARTATFAYLLPVVTGILTLRQPRHRRLHGIVARVVIVLTLLATLTGALMLWKAPRI
ncbi:MAG: hypothetical protein H6830_05695 [Planctomycetes bacterium]|nr:hypothetical protein [Planctomycetota bacterium]MCB9909016.1 hypothetical protein [Planctomycetota bacterium]MCB9911739.1 hypothetical protein [Planctomycetota bacterium]HPF14551.1 hypothetical protein [Planctomycetota bacterium]HRV82096.1 hypothetical protein [Planctomycetota bacterium]